MREHRIDVASTPTAALGAVGRVAAGWGADWSPDGSGGRLALPVTAGLRRGLVQGRVWAEPAHSGARLIFRVEDSHYILHRPAVVVLLVAAAGAMVTLFSPFFWHLYPELMALAPLGAVLALCAWFLVISRLSNSGPEDFLSLVAAEGDEGGREGLGA